jgi:pyruvate formate lyase activating enzyme
MQPVFLLEALKGSKTAGLHTTVDTSGYSSWKHLEPVADFTDLFLFDLKFMEESRHKQFTGVSNHLIKENLTRLLAGGHNVRIRIPVIPGYSDSEENIKETLDFLGSLSGEPEGVDLLPYHNTGAHKYIRFGLENRLTELKSLTKQDLKGLKNRFEKAGFKTNIGG